MPTIMCTKDFWRTLGEPDPLRDTDDDAGANSRLGRWTAKAIGLPEGDFVVGLNELTYLAVVFHLMPLPDLLLGFGYSVAQILSDLGFSDDICRAEAESFFAGTIFARNQSRSLLGTLNDICGNVDVFLEQAGDSEPETLAELQVWLSEMPHSKLDSHFPDKAVRLLFADAASA